MRRIKFKPSFRQTLTANSAYLAAMSPGGVLPADLQASLERTMPKLRQNKLRAEAERRAAAHEPNSDFPGVDIDSIHQGKRAAPRQLEAPVVQAISQLLSVHPRVLFACRQNSGMASYEAKSGRYAPVYFYRLLRHGKEVTITDFWGILKDGRMLAIEAKAPGFKVPRTDRELAQANFLAMIRNIGGVGVFATSAEEVAKALS